MNSEELRKDISMQNKSKYSLSGDIPSPDMFFATDRDALAFGWYDNKDSDKSTFAIQNRPIMVYTHSHDLDKDLKNKNTKNIDIYYPEFKFKSYYSRIEGRVGKVKTSKGERYMVSFWQNYDTVKPILKRTVDYIKKYLPIDVKNLIISTRDKVEYYNNIEEVKPLGKRAEKIDLLMQYHKETDPVKKKIIATKLGMVTPEPKKAKQAVLGDEYKVDNFKKLVHLAERIEYDYNDEEICFDGHVYAINAKFLYRLSREVNDRNGLVDYYEVPFAIQEFEAYRIKNWVCDDSNKKTKQMYDIINNELFPISSDSYVLVTDKNLEDRLKEYVLDVAKDDESIVQRTDPPEREDYD